MSGSINLVVFKENSQLQDEQEEQENSSQQLETVSPMINYNKTARRRKVSVLQTNRNDRPLQLEPLLEETDRKGEISPKARVLPCFFPFSDILYVQSPELPGS